MPSRIKRKGELEMAKIREMKVEDIPEVYRVGDLLFHSLELATLYRTWDAHEVTANFNQNKVIQRVRRRKGKAKAAARTNSPRRRRT